MKPLSDMALQAAEDGKISFYPDNYRKIFIHWMKNPIDWNISRQIAWGISIPAKVCGDCGFALPDLEDKVSVCEKCGAEMRKDTDTFDTWFSSGQWPLLALGFPDGKDFKGFYPTDMMESGSDLIFKWIPRMVIFGLYLAREVPFRNVYLHGLVNDAHGKKMSKSKGNVINPLDLTGKFGTDALRIGLVVGNTPGSDFSLSETKIRGYKNFGNKIWNIARFVLSNAGAADAEKKPELTEGDKLKMKEMGLLVKDMTREMDEYKFYIAAEKIYHYVWHTLADKYIEEYKHVLSGADEKAKLSAQWALAELFAVSLKLLHPFMPFITEEIWGLLPFIKNKKLLLVEEWPI